MTSSADLIGPFIVWENYGYEGWQPKSFNTLKEAITALRFNSEWIVTRLISYEVTEND